MNIDKLFSEVVGDLGYQQALYCLFFCLMNSYSAFQMLQYKFVVRDSSNFLCYSSAKIKDTPEIAIPNKCTNVENDSDSHTR